MNRVFTAIHDAEILRKDNTKMFEQKKNLKAKVTKLVHTLIEAPICTNHVIHHRDHQLKIDFVNQKWDRERLRGKKSSSKSN